ncbi:MAG: DUF7017 domain-containing protein [Bacteroidota bacterium]
MEKLFEINKELFALRQNKQYEKVLDYYKTSVHKQFEREEIIAHDYLVANLLHALRKSNKTLQAIEYMHNHLRLFPDIYLHTQTYYEYGWNLYQHIKHTEINHTNQTLPRYAADALKIISKELKKENYLLFSRLFFILSKKMLLKGEPAKRLDALFEQYTWEDFSPEPQKTTLTKKGVQKEIELASDQETFLVRRSKTLLLNQRYHECITHCEETLQKIQKFHQGNQLWISRNLSMALAQTGQTHHAIEKLHKVANTKKDWYLYHELAQMYQHAEKYEEALLWFCKAALRQGNTHYKTGLYENMSRFFEKTREHDQLCLHLGLANAIRKEQNWRIPSENQTLAKKHACQTDNGLQSEKIYEQLSKWWQCQTANHESQNYETGTITRILNDGENGDGFITAKGGKSIYFRFKKCQIPSDQIRQGVKVSFLATSRTYKGKEVWNATRVNLAEEKESSNTIKKPPQP